MRDVMIDIGLGVALFVTVVMVVVFGSEAYTFVYAMF